MKRTLRTGILSALLLLPGAAQEPGITREQAEAILSELRQIRLLLERAMRPPEAAEGPRKAVLRITEDRWLGDKNAPLTLVEFTDYQCSFCRRFHVVTFPELRKKYIETGKLRFASRDFPLEFHTSAFLAAEAARCAGDQGRYWEMRDLLVSTGKLSKEDLAAHARQLKLDAREFDACLATGKHRTAIQQDIVEATQLGINGTPGFVIGRSTPAGVEGEILLGAHPLAVFEEKLRHYQR
ncbi:MAG: DsbA family protein [Bryobacteraceae bacterium]